MGARQRFFHWAAAAVGLASFVAMGTTIGLLTYALCFMVLHLRTYQGRRGANVMDGLLRRRELALDARWRAFLRATDRRTMSLLGPPPHRLFGIFAILAVLILSVAFDGRISEGPGPAAIMERMLGAAAACTALWLAMFGLSRRTPLVLGSDGIRVRDEFVPYSAVVGFKHHPSGVVIRRASPLPPLAVPTSDPETAARLVEVLEAEHERLRRLRAEPGRLDPAAGLRDNALQTHWRVRVMDAGSDDERETVLKRVAPEELRALLDETADPMLEDALRTRLRGVD